MIIELILPMAVNAQEHRTQQNLCKSWADVINFNCQSLISLCAKAKQTYIKCPTFAKPFSVRHNNYQPY